MDIGVGLWAMQSTAHHPANHAAAFAAVADDARRAEALGFRSFWVAEHRFWYDGWSPAPLVAAAAAASATERLRVGTAMLLLPMHDGVAVARSAALVHRLSGGRLDLGVGLGYRDEEFDGLGVPRTERGRRMSANLDVLDRTWEADAPGAAHPPVWVGGMAKAALERGARRGCSFMLPPTLMVDEVAAAVERIRAAAAAAGTQPGRIGMVKDTWVEVDGDRARDYLHPRLTIGTTEYARGWWVFKGGLTGADRPDLVQAQVDRAHDASLCGDPDEVAAQLRALRDAGVDVVAMHLNRAATRDRLDEAMQLVADTILPEFHEVAHAR